MPLPACLATLPKTMRSKTSSRISILVALLQFPLALFGQTKAASPDNELNAFFETEWNYEMEQNPGRASAMGDRRWNDRWGDQSLEAIKKREEHAAAALERVKKFDRTKLSAANQLNYDLF